MNKWWLATAMLAACVGTSGCMMSSAGVRQWNGERVADQLAAIQSRVTAGDEGTRAQAAVDVFALSRLLQNGYLADWWAFSKVRPWPAIWRGGVDVAAIIGVGYAGYSLADGGSSGGGSEPAAKPVPSIGSAATATVSGDGNTVTQTITVYPPAEE